MKNIKKLLISAVMLFVANSVVSAQSNELTIYLLAGQSNMNGYNLSSELPSQYQLIQEDVKVYYDQWENDGWQYLGPGLSDPAGYAGTNSYFGPEITFGRTMADGQPQKNIALIKYAVGGTTLAENWRAPDANGQNAGELYTGFMNSVNSALSSLPSGTTAKIAGLIWMQGESDCQSPSMANAYKQNLTNFITSVRSDLNTPDLPVTVGRISDSQWLVDHDIVRRAQYDVKQSMNNVTLVNTDDLSRVIDGSEGVHYNTEATLELGSRFATSVQGVTGDVCPVLDDTYADSYYADIVKNTNAVHSAHFESLDNVKRVAYLKFDTACLVRDVNDVMLTLHNFTDVTAGGAVDIDVMLDGDANESWSEETLTWNNQPGLEEDWITLKRIHMPEGLSHLEEYEISLAELADYINSDTNGSITIRITPIDRLSDYLSQMSFASAELDGGAYSPVLNVEYIAATPEPTTLVLLMAGFSCITLRNKKK